MEIDFTVNLNPLGTQVLASGAVIQASHTYVFKEVSLQNLQAQQPQRSEGQNALVGHRNLHW